MAVARVQSAQPSIAGSDSVTIEADLSRGLYSFTIVGLPGKAVEEARDRVGSAIKNSGFPSPKSKNHKVVVSLAPADLKKEGPVFDLPIAVAYLIASKDIHASEEKRILVGELALDGTLRPIKGVLPIAKKAGELGFTEIIVPYENRQEAALIPEVRVIAARTLGEVVRHMDAQHPEHKRLEPEPITTIPDLWEESYVRLEDIRGQETAKRGLLLGAAGRHNMILVGPPGTGKTMLARTFRSLLPPLTREEALEVTAIHSVAGGEYGISSRPPFRAPHHTASYTSLVGGGTFPKPGEVTLAHKGVLFCDEFPEFERRAIDALRQPLEDRIVSISRVHSSQLFPADFILIAAMNPTRGGDEGGEYASQMLETYKNKISGPILDRIDLWLPVPRVDYETLVKKGAPLNSEETKRAREQILKARERQHTRFEGKGISTNAEMTARDIDEQIELSESVKNVLRKSAEKLNLSPRSYHRLVKVARTITDLDDKDHIEEKHVLEALQYRVKL